METLPYIDELFREYLLFRGFTETLQSLSREKDADKGQAWKADLICKTIFGELIPQHNCEGLVDLLEFLKSYVFSRLTGDLESHASKLEVQPR
jgi:hypothetical protein